MATLDDILKLDPLLFDAHWREIDQVVWRLNTGHEQIAAWEKIADRLKTHPVSKGMPYFRLGHMHLVTDADAVRAINYLELAYAEDVKYGPDNGQIPHRMGAYRLLALTKGFIEYLDAKNNWETEQLRLPHRPVVIRALLAVYDRSLAHILDLEGHTYQSFFSLIQDKSLTRFAIENYLCAERLIELFFVSGAHISRFTCFSTARELPLSARSGSGLIIRQATAPAAWNSSIRRADFTRAFRLFGPISPRRARSCWLRDEILDHAA